MSARQSTRQEAGSLFPSRAKLQMQGSFSRAKDGYKPTISTIPSSPSLVLRQSYSKFLAEERLSSSSSGIVPLNELDCEQTEALISNIIAHKISTHIKFDGRLLSMIDSWQELVDLEIGIAPVKAKLLFLRITELRDSGVPTSLLEIEVNREEFLPSLPPPPPPTPPPTPPPAQLQQPVPEPMTVVAPLVKYCTSPPKLNAERTSPGSDRGSGGKNYKRVQMNSSLSKPTVGTALRTHSSNEADRAAALEKLTQERERMALANRSNVNSSIPFQRVHQRPRRPSMAAIVVDDTKLNRSCSPTVFTKVAARPHFDARSPKERAKSTEPEVSSERSPWLLSSLDSDNRSRSVIIGGKSRARSFIEFNIENVKAYFGKNSPSPEKKIIAGVQYDRKPTDKPRRISYISPVGPSRIPNSEFSSSSSELPDSDNIRALDTENEKQPPPPGTGASYEEEEYTMATTTNLRPFTTK